MNIKLWLRELKLYNHIYNFFHMSRLGKKPIEFSDKTDVSVEGQTITVTGPEGELVREIPEQIDVSVEDAGVRVKPNEDSKQARALWGTIASHVRGMIRGVNEPYKKQLEFSGIGYRANVSGSTLKLEMGYSHDVELDIPDGLEVEAQKNVITVSGIDKEKVGQFAANVRQVRQPEPYKGTGIKYVDEVIQRKEGKKAI